MAIMLKEEPRTTKKIYFYFFFYAVLAGKVYRYDINGLLRKSPRSETAESNANLA